VIDRVKNAVAKLRGKPAAPPRQPPVSRPEAIVRAAIAAQAAFEEIHPIPFAPDQRRAAIRQRVTALAGQPPDRATLLNIDRLVS